MQYNNRTRTLGLAITILSVLQLAVFLNASVLQDISVERITVDELIAKVAHREPLLIIDVRSQYDYDESTTKIKGAVRIPLDKISESMGEIPRDREIVLYCACLNEGSSAHAARILISAGYSKVVALKDGWEAWVKSGGPVESK